MKNLFPGYYSHTDDELKQMLVQGIVIIDPTVLLNLFRYSERTVQVFMSTLTRIENRLWLPFQAAEQYHENILSVLFQEQSFTGNVIAAIKFLLEGLNDPAREPFIDLKALEKLNTLINKLEAAYSKKKEFSLLFFTKNPLKEKIAALYNGKVGPPCSYERLEQIFSQGEERCRENIPPCHVHLGEHDPKKKYSDLVLWTQIIEYSKTVKTPLTFICGEEKENWYYYAEGRALGPHPSLIAEMNSLTDIPFYIFTTCQFLTYARELINPSINGSLLNEVKLVEKRLKQVRSGRERTNKNNRQLHSSLAFADSAHTAQPAQGEINTLGKTAAFDEAMLKQLNDMLRHYTSGKTLFAQLDSLFRNYTIDQYKIKEILQYFTDDSDGDREIGD